MKKQQRREYNPSISEIGVKKMGGFTPGSGYNDKQYEGRSVNRDFVINNYTVKRASSDGSEHYNNIVFGGSDFNIKDKLFAKTESPDKLVHLGYRWLGTTTDPEEAERKQIIAEDKFKKEVRINIVKNASSDETIYELWANVNNDDSFQYTNVAQNLEQGVEKIASKVKKTIIPEGITKIAWNDAQRLGILSSMKDCGFDMYKEAGAGGDPHGIWWKESYTDNDTGETKYYLVKENGVERAVDLGDRKVKAIKGKGDNMHEQKNAETLAVKIKLAKTAGTKIANKVPIKKASVGDEREDGKDTPASKSVGVKNKTIDLAKGDWKKEITAYLKQVKDNGLEPQEIEVKVIKWVVNARVV